MLSTSVAVRAAAGLMTEFAERTGLTAKAPDRRYLWTDAFAVANFLELTRQTGEGRYLELALRLVARVHHVLGRHRDDDSRSGWISGLDERSGEAHPTRGGLRIGKTLAERRIGEALDERLEWERDGQYFHYLTKWMHALNLVARATGQQQFLIWARELAEAAHRGFTCGPSSRGHRRMVWKMSIDLSRPLVSSMGHHDALDGFVTCIELQRDAASPTAGPGLREETGDFAAMIDERELATADPLGIGGLLMDASRLAQLLATQPVDAERLLDALLVAAQQGLAHYTRQSELRLPASRRLAFRELGLAIGLSAVDLVAREVRQERLRFAASARYLDGVEGLEPYKVLGPQIVSFWMDPSNRLGGTWRNHQDINDVMLATSLLPEGFVLLRAAG